MRRDALFSKCGRYRYALARQFPEQMLPGKPGGSIAFVLLNPSTADARLDDPTVRRCIGFAQRQGAATLEILNVYALRSRDPAALRVAEDPVGPGNDDAILEVARRCFAVVVGWGAFKAPFHSARLRLVQDILERAGQPLFCLGTTAEGAPRHPLYVRADAPLVPWPVGSAPRRSEPRP